MRKKTELRTTLRRQVARASHDSGLTANQHTLKRSVRTESPLDNRSHRTPKLSCERVHKSERGALAIRRSFVSFSVPLKVKLR